MSNAGQDPAEGSSYRLAGVDITKGNALVSAIAPLAASTARVGSESKLGGFGGLFDLKACGYLDPVLVAANDGVGTKLKVAIDMGVHHTIGIDLVAMSVNDLVVQGAEPLFFLDYFATGKLDLAVGQSILAGIAAGCREAGCALIGGETAEMPGLYHGSDYDLAGFAVGAVERKAILPRTDIFPGDAILGIASSGLHSNGYSLVRRLVEQSGVNYEQPAPFEPSRTLGDILLTPTVIYVKPLLAALKQGVPIKALAHITGGGLIENIPRVLPESVAAEVDLSAISPPPVFGWLSRTGQIAEREMLRTFNCGVGMIAVVPQGEASAAIVKFTEHHLRAAIIGSIVKRSKGEEPMQFHNRLRLS